MHGERRWQYQHVALDGDLEQKYQEAMEKVDL
jgi:hypothetical protein